MTLLGRQFLIGREQRLIIIIITNNNINYINNINYLRLVPLLWTQRFR